jgi:hypothetical protein
MSIFQGGGYLIQIAANSERIQRPLSGVWTFLPTVPFLLHRVEFH